MKLHVEDKLYIESDEMQYILKQYSGINKDIRRNTNAS